MHTHYYYSPSQTATSYHHTINYSLPVHMWRVGVCKQLLFLINKSYFYSDHAISCPLFLEPGYHGMICQYQECKTASREAQFVDYLGLTGNYVRCKFQNSSMIPLKFAATMSQQFTADAYVVQIIPSHDELPHRDPAW